MINLKAIRSLCAEALGQERVTLLSESLHSSNPIALTYGATENGITHPSQCSSIGRDYVNEIERKPSRKHSAKYQNRTLLYSTTLGANQTSLKANKALADLDEYWEHANINGLWLMLTSANQNGQLSLMPAWLIDLRLCTT